MQMCSKHKNIKAGLFRLEDINIYLMQIVKSVLSLYYIGDGIKQ